jgi:hypothetical protein
MSLSFSNSQNKFPKHLYLQGKVFHKLEQLANPSTKVFKMKTLDQFFHFTKEQLFLLSPATYQFIQQLLSCFSIPLSIDNPKISSDSLINSFEKIFSLFATKTQIKISKPNIYTFHYLSQILKIIYLNQYAI